jgi:hypothetical protein
LDILSFSKTQIYNVNIFVTRRVPPVKQELRSPRILVRFVVLDHSVL